MPVPKKKPTTSTSKGSTPERSSPVLPEQEEFRQHLRRLAVSAVQVLMEQIMLLRIRTVHRSLMGRMYS
jgi:hypothetical protein